MSEMTLTLAVEGFQLRRMPRRVADVFFVPSRLGAFVARAGGLPPVLVAYPMMRCIASRLTSIRIFCFAFCM
jgi:hypothetical protein